MPNDLDDALSQLQLTTFDDALGRRIIDTHIWAVREGLRGADAYRLFDGYCQRLVIDGTPLWRAHAAMETLHPQWSGYGYTWRRDLNAIEPEQYAHGGQEEPIWVRSPFYALIQRAAAGEDSPAMRRRIEAGPDERDFPVLEELFALGATDYLAQLFAYGDKGDRSQGTGIVYSFATDAEGGFSDDDATLIQATLPGLSLAMKAHAGHVIASGLLGAYLGQDAGARVHAGSVMRGSVDGLRAVLWYADIRGFTAISDQAAGPVVVDLLNDVFEVLTASLRERGGQVLKFIGDGMLATFAVRRAGSGADLRPCARRRDRGHAQPRRAQCGRARSAARLSPPSISPSISATCSTATSARPTGSISLSSARPINEVARIEALCEPLGRSVLASAEFVAAASDCSGRLESLGRRALRGVRQPKEIFALDLGAEE